MSISISYELDVSNAARNKLTEGGAGGVPGAAFSYPLTSSSTTTSSDATITHSTSFYAELSSLLRQATSEVGDRLTEWRDAVGNEEKEKERVAAAAAQARKAADDDASDEEESI